MRDEEGEKNQKTAKESDYVQMSRKERVGRSGDLIYRNKRKKIQIITHLLSNKSLP